MNIRDRKIKDQFGFNLTRLFSPNMIIGVDMASGKDYTCVSYFKTPGKIRQFLRKIKIDRSTWQYKLIRNEFKR